MLKLYNSQVKDIDNFTTIYNKKEKRYEEWCQDIICFDTETTSAWISPKGKIEGYVPGKNSEYWESRTPFGFVYIWMLSIEGKGVFYGRELKDFLKVLNDFDKTKHYIIWIHNLSFEYTFFQSILNFEEDGVFARAAHKVMKATPKEYPNIEFRCTYFLTNQSLENWGQSLSIQKAVGFLDYEKIRTPLTPLTDKELEYCEKDVLVMEAGLQKYREQYQTLKNIPLTQTGTVRREVKNILMGIPDYALKIKRLIPQDAEMYRVLRDTYAGGLCNACLLYSGVLQKGDIHHYDYGSSYPARVVSEKYPMSPWVMIEPQLPDDKMFEDYAYIMRIRFHNIESIKYNNFIQVSKCVGTKMVKDNGRLIRAEELELTMTEQDWLTYRDCYKWDKDKLEVLEVWESRKGYLPKELIEYVLELYENKTKLKDVPGKVNEDLYQRSKEKLNSIYGMCVTAIVNEDVLYKGIGDWECPTLTEDMVNEKLNDLHDPKNHNYFLSYSWGIYISAYARRALCECIAKYDDRVLYYDTDSIFMIGAGDWTDYNTKIVEKLDKTCNYYGIDPERTRPKNPKGKKKQLGIFAEEEECSEFLTLGAKRYVERRKKDGKLHLTVSGINKEAVEMLEDNIENFQIGFNFDKDDPSVKKRLRTYCENQKEVVMPDGWVMRYKCGVNLRRNGYMLKDIGDYGLLAGKDLFIDYIVDILDDDKISVSLRGEF